MKTVTVTSEGWTVDRITWEALGDPSPAPVEETLRLNPGLAALGAILPVGTTLTIPDPPSTRTPERSIVRLWD